MLLHDQRVAQRDHEQHAEQAAHHGDRGDRAPGERVAEEEQRGEGEDDARGDRLAGGAGGLHHVVLEDRRRLGAEGRREIAEDRDREHRDRDRRAHGETDLEREVHARRGEDEPEEDAEDDGAGGELGEHRRWRRRKGIAARGAPVFGAVMGAPGGGSRGEYGARARGGQTSAGRRNAPPRSRRREPGTGNRYGMTTRGAGPSKLSSSPVPGSRFRASAPSLPSRASARARARRDGGDGDEGHRDQRAQRGDEAGRRSATKFRQPARRRRRSRSSCRARRRSASARAP